MRTRKFAVLAAAVVLAGMLAACGGGKNGGGAAGIVIDESNKTQADSAIEIKAKNFEFDQAEYRVKSGDAVKFQFVSEEGVHGVRIQKTGIELRDGQAVTVTFENPGEYEIICNIPCGTGHSQMFAKLIVEA